MLGGKGIEELKIGGAIFYRTESWHRDISFSLSSLSKTQRVTFGLVAKATKEGKEEEETGLPTAIFFFSVQITWARRSDRRRMVTSKEVSSLFRPHSLTTISPVYSRAPLVDNTCAGNGGVWTFSPNPSAGSITIHDKGWLGGDGEAPSSKSIFGLLILRFLFTRQGCDS